MFQNYCKFGCGYGTNAGKGPIAIHELRCEKNPDREANLVAMAERRAERKQRKVALSNVAITRGHVQLALQEIIARAATRRMTDTLQNAYQLEDDLDQLFPPELSSGVAS